MINTIVCHILEVIFGLFLISVLADFLLGIDVIGELMKFYNWIVYGKKSDVKEEKGEKRSQK
jgi:hypothetical protein